jgi:hypothetical protein
MVRAGVICGFLLLLLENLGPEGFCRKPSKSGLNINQGWPKGLRAFRSAIKEVPIQMMQSS